MIKRGIGTGEGNSDSIGDWEKQKLAFQKSPISHSVYWLLGILAGFGFFYNYSQNSNRLFTLAWFIDVIVLSWTNLLVLPLFIFTIIVGYKVKSFGKFQYSLSLFITSPFMLILGTIGIKFFLKLVEFSLNGISNFFAWLSS
jgi:hypothetical protein